MPGIMMSISTRSMSGSSATCSIASWPVPAVITPMPWRSSTLDSAKMLRTSSSTTSTRLPTQRLVGLVQALHHRCLAGGRSAITRCRNSAVSSSRRSGDSHALDHDALARALRRRSSSSAAQVLAGEHHDRHVAQRAARPGCWSSSSKPDMSGRRRSSTTQSKRASRMRRERFGAGADACRSRRRRGGSAPRCSSARAASSSTTSSSLACAAACTP